MLSLIVFLHLSLWIASLYRVQGALPFLDCNTVKRMPQRNAPSSILFDPLHVQYCAGGILDSPKLLGVLQSTIAPLIRLNQSPGLIHLASLLKASFVWATRL